MTTKVHFEVLMYTHLCECVCARAMQNDLLDSYVRTNQQNLTLWQIKKKKVKMQNEEDSLEVQKKATDGIVRQNQ